LELLRLVDLQQMHMHLMRHFIGAYWGTKSETHSVERFSHMFLTAISTTTVLFAKDTSIKMRVALTEVRMVDRATAVLSALLCYAMLWLCQAMLWLCQLWPGYEGD
jgi:hypothetical protein